MNPHFSIGTDIVEIPRIGKLARKRRFLERVFTAAEIRYCSKKKNSAQHFAVRFAAKEAVWKALSDTRVKGIRHKEIGVQRKTNGKPFVSLSRRLKKFERKISLSLSHSKKYATAVALFQRK